MKKPLKDSFNDKIRRATPADLQAIVDIENDGYSAADRYPPQLLDDYLQAAEEDPDIVVLIADEAAGYTLGQIMGDDRHGEIIDLAVTKEHRGQGLGRELLERVAESLHNKGAEKIILYVRPDNAAAIHLYESSGFVKTADMPRYYGDSDGVQMTRRFKL